MIAIGLDIGTTSICAAAVDGGSGRVLETRSVPNESWIAGEAWERKQDPNAICAAAEGLASEMIRRYGVGAVGVTGQMHGILYVDGRGRACSPLYTWQDERGGQTRNGGTYASEAKEITGRGAAVGYGCVTHFYNAEHGLVPADARRFCTVHDYVAMRLAGGKEPVCDATDAASFGVFDVENGRFDVDAFERLGLDSSLLPRVCDSFTCVGKTESGAPVAVALGDNQASFLGSVTDAANTVLVNVGTGSQTSVYTKRYGTRPGVEARPMAGGGYLLVGAALAGGRCYAMLESFFRDVAERATGEKLGPLYDRMDQWAREAWELSDLPVIDTSFSGTRENPTRRGAISEIGTERFTPGAFCVGMLRGMAGELFALYRETLPLLERPKTRLVGSGNGIRKNPLLRRATEEVFGLPMEVPDHEEEAACGAALVALTSVGVFGNLAEAQKRMSR